MMYITGVSVLRSTLTGRWLSFTLERTGGDRMKKWIRTMVQLTPEQNEALRELTYRDRRSLAFMIREAVDKYVEYRKEGKR